MCWWRSLGCSRGGFGRGVEGFYMEVINGPERGDVTASRIPGCFRNVPSGPWTRGRADTPTRHSAARHIRSTETLVLGRMLTIDFSVRDLRLRQSRILRCDQILALHCCDWVRAIIGCVKGARTMISR